jgi:hypothetical protein
MTDKKNNRLDMCYLYTISGILKMVQILLNLTNTIAISFSKTVALPHGISFLVVSVGGFFITGILLGCHTFCPYVMHSRIPWLKIEFIYCCLWTVCSAVVASVAADVGRIDEAFFVSSVFAYLSMIAYGYDTFLKFSDVYSGDSAQ